MKSRRILYFALFPITLGAQEARDVVPLKNWSNPLYWRASQAERDAIGRPEPQFRLSPTQVSTDPLSFVAITPCRLLDTRGTATGFSSSAPWNAPIAAAGTLTIPVQADASNAACGTIPSIAQAYSVNVTLVPVASGQVNFLTVWPAAATQPAVATMNDKTGLVLANAAIVPAGFPSGGISVFNSGPSATNVVIDMNGFFVAPTDVNANTAIGENALNSNTTGIRNTASGIVALQLNTTGSDNTASGAFALNANTTGSNNTALGSSALFNNTSGYDNTATGQNALVNNTTGIYNTATGQGAMYNNTTGNYNAAFGATALQDNTIGAYNTATGQYALLLNTTGSNNTATGEGALEKNTTASGNTAIGQNALFFNTVGGGNIAIGASAGLNAPIANTNSIYIGSQGFSGDASGTIQIGTQGTQTGGTSIAGIYGAVAFGGTGVYVNSSGQLGTINAVFSSRLAKEQITDMGDHSSKLYDLRPVNFYYKPEYDDGSHMLQYGLIAEEVAEIFPEMVTHGKDGQVTGVKYQVLTPMLLNELQKQARQIRSLEDELAAIKASLSATLPELVR